MPGGIAALSGKLKIGDRILKVNGTDVTGATHQETVTELLRPCDEIKLTVQHDPLPPGFQVSIFLFYSILIKKKKAVNILKLNQLLFPIRINIAFPFVSALLNKTKNLKLYHKPFSPFSLLFHSNHKYAKKIKNSVVIK